MSHRSSPRPSSWRRVYVTYRRAGQSARAKRRTRRRERAELKRDLASAIAEADDA